MSEERPDLGRAPIFGDLAAEEQEALLTLAARRRLATGEALFYEGDPAETLYLLLTGRCALSYGHSARGQIGPGAFVDPAAALGGRPRAVKAVALSDCE